MMKKILFVLLICLPSAFAAGQNIVYDTIRYAKEYYKDRVALFKKEPVQKGNVLFLGNSLTQFADWKKLLNDSTVVNRGVAGDNTFGVLDRLDDVIARRPSRLFIEIGINDISQNIPITIIVKNIFTIVGRVKAKSLETKIFVHSILPTNDNVKNTYPDAFNKNSVVDSVNNRLKQNARRHKFTFIDLSMELRDKNGNLDVKYADPDGLHLNEFGYLAWIKLLKTKMLVD